MLQYAACFASCSTKAVLEKASKLVMASFNRCITEYNKLGHSGMAKIGPPLSEASAAFKQLLCSSPDHFSTPEARASLESECLDPKCRPTLSVPVLTFSFSSTVAWKMPYTCEQVTIEDRELLCSGLCSVIISLPSDQWHSSLDSLTQPIHSCLNTVTREAEMMTGSAGAAEGKLDDKIDAIMSKLSNEIRLLAAVVRCFSKADTAKNFFEDDRSKMISSSRNALVSLLHKSWPCLLHVGKKFTSYEVSERGVRTRFHCLLVLTNFLPSRRS